MSATAYHHCRPSGAEVMPIASQSHGALSDSIDGTATSSPCPHSEGEATTVAVPRRARDSRPEGRSAASTAAAASATNTQKGTNLGSPKPYSAGTF